MSSVSTILDSRAHIKRSERGSPARYMMIKDLLLGAEVVYVFCFRHFDCRASSFTAITHLQFFKYRPRIRRFWHDNHYNGETIVRNTSATFSFRSAPHEESQHYTPVLVSRGDTKKAHSYAPSYAVNLFETPDHRHRRRERRASERLKHSAWSAVTGLLYSFIERRFSIVRTRRASIEGRLSVTARSPG